jgi:hypothetical protein
LASFFLWLWFGLVTLVGCLVCFLALIFLSVNPTPWNFPGDPPLFEYLLAGAAANLVLVAVLWAVLRWTPVLVAVSGSLPRLVRRVLIYWAVIVLICVAGILERQDPRWRQVRMAIRQFGNAIAADAGDRYRVLSREEFLALREKHVPTPVPLSLPGRGTVYLRMAHTVYPYVGIDFGSGGNAFFEPLTMLCTYSD